MIFKHVEYIHRRESYIQKRRAEHWVMGIGSAREKHRNVMLHEWETQESRVRQEQEARLRL